MTTVCVATKTKKLCGDFCSSIEVSKDIKIINTFFTIKDCREALATRRPDVLLFGLDLPGDREDADWVEFCIRIRTKYPDMKILTVISYSEYVDNKESLNNLTSGYISKDALPNMIITAIEAVKQGKFFRYDRIAAPVKNEEPKPEWLNTMNREMIKNVIVAGSNRETIEKLSQLMEAIETIRMNIIQTMLEKEKDQLDADYADSQLILLIENLLIKGHPNWEIADMLNVSIEKVRLYRLEFILRMTGKNSMVYGIRSDGKTIKLGRRELQLLRLIAAGYTNQEIADKHFSRSIETVKKERKGLVEKFGAKNSMSMVISALRMGLIKMEDIDLLSLN